jgi:hypothetical protein
MSGYPKQEMDIQNQKRISKCKKTDIESDARKNFDKKWITSTARADTRLLPRWPV